MSWRLPTAVVGLVAMLLLHATTSLLPHLHGTEAPSEAGMAACGDDSPHGGRLAAPDTSHGGRCLACSLHGPAATTTASSPVLPTPLGLDGRTEGRSQPAKSLPVQSLRSRGPPARV